MAKNYNTIILDKKIYTQRTPNSKFVKSNFKGEVLEKFDDLPSEIEKIIKLYEDTEKNPDRYFDYEILFNQTIKINKIIYNPNITTHFKVPEFIDDLPVCCIGSNVLSEELRLKLEQIDLPDSIDFLLPSAFANCISLQVFNMPKSLKTLSENCFLNCINLKNVFLQNVENIRKNAFEGCKSLLSIDLSNIKHLGLYAFSNCISLKRIKLSEKLQILPSGAFSNCKSLSSITIPSNIARIYNDAFTGCDNLVDITMANNTTYEEDAFTFKQKLNMKIKKEMAEENLER